MKCHACGHENPDTALFCADCRRPLVAPARLPTPLSAMVPPPPPPPPAVAASTMTGLLAPMGSAADAASTVGGRYAPPNADATGARGVPSGEEISEEDAWGAVVGNANAHYYLERFERLSRGGTARWHWPAFFFTWYWLLYRKMWKWAAIYFFAPSIVGGIIGAAAGGSKTAGPFLLLAWWAFLLIGPPMMANGLYFAHCEKLIRDVRARGGSRAQILARLEATGGTSGIVAVIVGIFVVIAIVGILAAIALPAYQTYTQKAKVADAVISATAVTRAIGSAYEQTGALPSSSDVDRMVSQAPPSRYVRDMSLDPANGVLTVRVDLPPKTEGSLLFVPKADEQRHVTWTCVTEDLGRYVSPKVCSSTAPGGK